MILASCQASGIAVDPNGRPVWPLADPADRSAVAEACRTFDRTIAWVEAVPGAGASGSDVVVAYGAEAVAVASLYAHLTGRRLEVARDRAELSRLRRYKVIVCLMERIDDDLLEGMYAGRRRSSPGLITGATQAELRLRALVCAVAATADVRELPHRVELLPSFDIATVPGDNHTIIGRQSAADDIRTALARGASAVMIHGHGDGIDGDFGSLVLCPVDDEWQRRVDEHAPVCRTTGLCYRRKVAIASAEYAAARLHPAQISARALLWNTCVGFPSPHTLVHPRWGAGSGLASSARIGAFLTTWRIVIAAPTLTMHLMDRIMAGETLGSALARHNMSAPARRSADTLCLFGDPDTRVAPMASTRRAAPRRAGPAARPRTPPKPQDPHADPALRFIDSCLGNPRARRASGSEPILDDLHARACEALAQARAARPGRDEAGVDSSDRLRTAFATYAAHRGTVRDLWLPKAGSIEAAGNEPCGSCGSMAVRYRADFSRTQMPPRVLIICNRCEVVADRPERRAVSARVAHAGIELLGEELDSPAWAGVVTVRSRWPVTPRYWTWPADPAGRPARFRSLADAAWPHASELSLFLMIGFDLCILARTLRAIRPRDDAPSRGHDLATEGARGCVRDAGA
jgi:hypothetical protein